MRLYTLAHLPSWVFSRVSQSKSVLAGIYEWPQMPVGMQSKKMFNLRKIMKKFLMNLEKTRWKFERTMETIREEN